MLIATTRLSVLLYRTRLYHAHPHATQTDLLSPVWWVDPHGVRVKKAIEGRHSVLLATHRRIPNNMKTLDKDSPTDALVKWTDHDYLNDRDKPKRLLDWKPPRLDLFAVSDTEKDALHALKDAFEGLDRYTDAKRIISGAETDTPEIEIITGMESQAIANTALVEAPTPIPPGYIAFLENTAERCTSPDTKHSQAGMNRAKEWVQRIDTPERMFERLTRGYGISMMFGERFHQFIRNGHNWRGASGIMLDIDLFLDDDHPDAPEPVYSMDALFDRLPVHTPSMPICDSKCIKSARRATVQGQRDYPIP